MINNNFRYDINGLRAWAVIAVMLYHFNIPFFSGGFIGVDIFFVISGFLMTKIIMTGIDNHNFSIINFYVARAKRIIPALTILCLLTLIIGYLFLATSEYLKMAESVRSAIFFTSNLLFKSQFNYFNDIALNQWLLHTWSLSVEWQFYLFLPIFLMITAKFFSKKTIASFLLILTIASLTCCMHKVYRANPSLSTAFYSFEYRAWEMLTGGLSWVFFAQIKIKHTLRKVLDNIGFVLIILSMLFINKEILWPSLFTLFPVTATCLIIIANRQDALLTNNKICQWLGNNSYSIYLYHWLIVMLITHLGFSDKIYTLIGIVLSIILGELSYRFIEIPAKQFFNKTSFKVDVINYLIAVGIFSLIFYAVKNKLLIPLINYKYVEYEYNSDIRKLSVNEVKSASDDWDFPSGLPELTIKGVNVYGILKEKNTLFYGDSNAQQYARLVKKLINQSDNRGAVFLTNPSCASIATINWKQEYASCKNAVNDLFILLSEDKFDRVVLSTLFTQYLITRGDLYSINGFKLSSERGKTAYFKELDNFIHKIISLGKTVYIVETIPTGDSLDSSNILTYKNGKLIYNMQPIFIAKLKEKSAFIHDNFIRMKEKYHINIINPIESLCDEEACYFTDKAGNIIYKDYCHLKPSYAEKYITYLDETMK